MLRDKIIAIFVKVDIFVKEFKPMLEEKIIEARKLGKPNRKAGLCKVDGFSDSNCT